MATLPRLVFSASTNWVDTTAPTLVSAEVQANGTDFEMVFSEAVTYGAGGTGGFTLDTSGAAVTLAYASGTGTNTLTYTLSRTVNSTETMDDFDYAQPGTGWKDLAGNNLATFDNQQALVTNSSTQGSLTLHAENTAATYATYNVANATTAIFAGQIAYNPGANITLKRVIANLSAVGTITSIDWVMDVYDYDGTDLSTLVQSSSAVTGDAWSETDVTFDFSGASLISGNQYAIVLRRSDSSSNASNYARWVCSDSGYFTGLLGNFDSAGVRQSFSNIDAKVKLYKP
jgi:hypothetical protein